MVERLDIANVTIWGMPVGAVVWQGSGDGGHGAFQYHRSFLAKGLELSPIHMGTKEALTGEGIFVFRKRSADPELDTFKGLPGLLADSLPDKFGNAVIDAWLARQGRDSSSFNPVERLCYMGSRGMGALEFHPPLNSRTEDTVPIEISHLVELAHQITVKRGALDVSLTDNDRGNAEALLEILRVGTSAGGARAKAVIAMNEEGHILSGQTNAPPGYAHWLLKFDGAGDLELGKTQGYGRIEYAYHLMARHCGIEMAQCRLLEEGGRAHFVTRRFDRPGGKKLHMQSLCGLAHYDYNRAGAYGYEQAFAVMRKLRLSKQEAAQQFRRMVFNVIARNQDDHTKNIAFLMDRNGKWKLSPAFDVMYAHDPHGKWTNNHQMTINGKRDDFTLQDLAKVAQSINLPNHKEIIEEVAEGVRLWPEFAKEAGVSKERISRIGNSFRLSILGERPVPVATINGGSFGEENDDSAPGTR
jgi:serine/threonine-protein kinase HipA